MGYNIKWKKPEKKIGNLNCIEKVSKKYILQSQQWSEVRDGIRSKQAILITVYCFSPNFLQ